MRVVLIRHGQTPSNVLGLLDTTPPGPGLTDRGFQEAEAVPATLAGEHLDVLFASTARRAQETAAPLARERGLQVQIRNGLREIAAGDWEMAGDEPTVLAYLELVGAWLDGQLDLRSPGPTGESGREVLARFDEVVDEIATSGVGAVAIVAHGAILRFWAGVRAANLAPGFGARHRLYNTGVIVVDGAPDHGWECVSWTGRPVVDGVPVEPSAAID